LKWQNFALKTWVFIDDLNNAGFRSTWQLRKLYFFLEVERSSAQDISKKCLTSCSKDFVFVQNAIPWRNMVIPGSQDQRDLRSGRSAQGRLCCGLNRYMAPAVCLKMGYTVYHGIPWNCPSLITEMVISYWIWDDLGVFHFQRNQLVVPYKWIGMNPTSRDVSG
jgi:hypothetical protein